MCGTKLKDRFPSRELRERLGIDDIALVLHQNRLRWYGHVLRKEDNDWVKKCMEYQVEGSRPRGRPKRTWRGVVKKDCQARKLNTEDAMDRSKWRKLIRDIRWSGLVWVGEFLLVPAYLGSPGSMAVKRFVCVCVLYWATKTVHTGQFNSQLLDFPLLACLWVYPRTSMGFLNNVFPGTSWSLSWHPTSRTELANVTV